MSLTDWVQWAAILFLGIMVLGLTRQLGIFMTPHKEELMIEAPALGRHLPQGLLSAPAAAQAAQLIEGTSDGFGVLVIIDNHCMGCMQMVEHLEKEGEKRKRLPPLIALLRSNDSDFRQRAGIVFDLVDDDPEGKKSKEAGIIATPFSMVLGKDLLVEHREIGAGIDDLILNWFEKVGKAVPQADGINLATKAN